MVEEGAHFNPIFNSKLWACKTSQQMCIFHSTIHFSQKFHIHDQPAATRVVSLLDLLQFMPPFCCSIMSTPCMAYFSPLGTFTSRTSGIRKVAITGFSLCSLQPHFSSVILAKASRNWAVPPPCSDSVVDERQARELPPFRMTKSWEENLTGLMHGDMRVAIIKEQQPTGKLTAWLGHSNARNESPQQTNSIHVRAKIYTQKCQWSTDFQCSVHNTKKVLTHKNILRKTRDAFPDTWCMLCQRAAPQCTKLVSRVHRVAVRWIVTARITAPSQPLRSLTVVAQSPGTRLVSKPCWQQYSVKDLWMLITTTMRVRRSHVAGTDRCMDSQSLFWALSVDLAQYRPHTLSTGIAGCPFPLAR